MRLNKFLLIGLTAFLVFSCDKDDDGTETVPPRDRGEVAIEDDQEIIEYLSTHFYNYEEFENPSEDFDYQIEFDTIEGANADKTPIIDSEKLITRTVNFAGVDQQLYILKIREGAGEKPAFTDSTYVAYKGQLLSDAVFESNLKSPVWFNLSGFEFRGSNGQIGKTPTPVKGFIEALKEFREATGFEVQPDNTVKWNNDYGIGAVFLPSGLGYFNTTKPAIPAYSPLIFNINMYDVNQADHDRDGIPSFMEDLDEDGEVYDDDTDEDGLSNHSDPDDDGDGTPTRDEIEIMEDGTIIFTDSNNDGTPDYLDPDTFQ